LKDGLEEETFEHHKSGLIAIELEKDPSLSYQTGDYWSQIVDKRYNFFLASSAAMDHWELVCNEVISIYLRLTGLRSRLGVFIGWV
jgi:nardilysin